MVVPCRGCPQRAAHIGSRLRQPTPRGRPLPAARGPHRCPHRCRQPLPTPLPTPAATPHRNHTPTATHQRLAQRPDHHHQPATPQEPSATHPGQNTRDASERDIPQWTASGWSTKWPTPAVKPEPPPTTHAHHTEDSEAILRCVCSAVVGVSQGFRWGLDDNVFGWFGLVGAVCVGMVALSFVDNVGDNFDRMAVATIGGRVVAVKGEVVGVDG